MGAIRARLIAGVIAAVLGALTSWLGAEVTNELRGSLETILGALFDSSLILYYAVIHPWIQKKWNPTGAYTSEAALSMEHRNNVVGKATLDQVPERG